MKLHNCHIIKENIIFSIICMFLALPVLYSKSFMPKYKKICGIDNYFKNRSISMFGQENNYVRTPTVKILKFGTPQTIAIIVLKIEMFDVTLH